jgi:hypothetical protein
MLIKFKLTLKSESKSYSYNKISTIHILFMLF